MALILLFPRRMVEVVRRSQIEDAASNCDTSTPGMGRYFCAAQTAASLHAWGLPLGVTLSESYREGAVTLAHGNLLVVYSDGLSEARPDLFRDHETLAAQITGDDFAATTAKRIVELATANGPLPDDLTVVVVKRRRLA